jgi:hypothetical protein
MSEPDPVIAQASSTQAPSPEELKRALKAFKKRLKLTQLDDQSRVGVGPLTGGRPSGIVAITPPNQYPRAVWDALVEQGRLKRASQGQYEIVQ